MFEFLKDYLRDLWLSIGSVANFRVTRLARRPERRANRQHLLSLQSSLNLQNSLNLGPLILPLILPILPLMLELQRLTLLQNPSMRVLRVPVLKMTVLAAMINR